jgi:hypothetical protein
MHYHNYISRPEPVLTVQDKSLYILKAIQQTVLTFITV